MVASERAQIHADAAIAVIAARQHGVISWLQLLDVGLRPGAIAHRCRTGLLHRLYRGVFAVGYRPLTREGQWMAAVLAYGRRGVLSHTSALALWDLRPSNARLIDVTVGTRNGLAGRTGVRLHRCGTLTPEETTTHRSIRITSVARTLLDVAAALQPHALARAVERAEILELFDLRAIDRTLELHPRHTGARKLAAAVARFREDDITRSDLEAMVLGLCEANGLPRPLVNHIVHDEEVDFLWPARRLIAEADGRRTHLTRAAFERDRAKDAKLTIAGYRVVRFTYRQILHDRRSVAATLGALLGELSPSAR